MGYAFQKNGMVAAQKGGKEGKATVFSLRATIGNTTAGTEIGGRRQHLATAPQRKEVRP